jgi:membrane-associated phospholipid phosphatase
MPLRLLPLALLLLVPPAAAQEEPVVLSPPRPGDFDARAFYAVYDLQHPLFEGAMRYTNDASLPLFVVVVPVLGTAALLTTESEAPTARILLSELGALGLVAATKLVVNRARPYAALPDVAPRQRRPPGGLDPYSFPSGHSAMAFGIATSASLSYPEWYVVVPAMTWATATALARVWHGMHYPTDIAVGAALGVGTAVAVHAIFAGDDEAGPPAEARVPVVTFRIGL